MSVAIQQRQATLKDFPPTVRKVIQYVMENRDYDDSLTAICEKAQVNYHTVSEGILRARKKGISFYDYLHYQRESRLRRYGVFVDNGLLKGAIDGRPKHLELYYRRMGELIDKQEIKHDIGLSFVFHSNSNPTDVTPNLKSDPIVIDVEPAKLKPDNK